MTTITCKIPEELDARLEAAARERRVPKSVIVRQAIEQQVKRTRIAKPPRAWDAVKHLCGVLHGPANLSSNPGHLEDFGA